MQSNSISAAVLAAIPGGGAPLVVLPHVALYDPQYLGLPPPKNPVLAARSLIARGRFPLPLVKVMGRNMVRVQDIFGYIHGLMQVDVPHSTPPAPKRGRRRNVAPPISHPAMLDG